MIKQSSWGWTVQEQLEKNKQLKLSDLKELQAWMKKEEHLPTIPEEQIVLFHHACEYEIDKTKETIEKCYTMRTNSKDIFSNRDPLHKFIQEITKVVICTPLAGFDKDGNQVIWMKLLDKDPDKYYYGVSIKQVIMVMDAVQLEYGPVPGYVFVVDGKGYTLSHMLRSSLSLCKKFITYSQEGSTFFPKAMYLLNVSTILEKAISLVKPFMKSDLFSVISFHKPGKFDEIHKQIPENIIPDEYGGSGGPIAEIHEEYLKKMLKYTDWFKEEEKLRIDESKRKGGKGSGKKAEKEKTTHEAEHLSLRTLDID